MANHYHDKIQQFKEIFLKQTGQDLHYIVRAPGRVNLIGDHIDYHGFPVLPMAIENCIWFGCSFNQCHNNQIGDQSITGRGNLEIFNTDADSYAPFKCQHSFSHGHQLDESHKWFHYILCGYHGVLTSEKLKIPAHKICEYTKNSLRCDEDCHQEDVKLKELPNLTILVDSNLPPASGLSSSSALVCASALATSLLLNVYNDCNDPNGYDETSLMLDKEQLAEKCSKFEHLIGTHGGGMDQAVILTAQHGYAKFVEFVPKIKCENVRLPRDVTWLVSHCGNSYPKAATSGFNSRVLETRLGAAIIAKTYSSSKNFKYDHSITLGKVKRELFGTMPTKVLVKLLREKVFLKSEYSIDEITTLLGMTRTKLIENFKTNEQILTNDLDNRVKLLSRCQHVFEEADRVEKFKSICSKPTNDSVSMLGDLMTQSHYSLRDKYECSHPDLDKLVEVALNAGALGARLTGAGWGGCIVSLVETWKSEDVFRKLKEVSRFTFTTEPQSGCCIIKVRE